MVYFNALEYQQALRLSLRMDEIRAWSTQRVLWLCRRIMRVRILVRRWSRSSVLCLPFCDSEEHVWMFHIAL